ncbi:MAG: hypothetical protein RMK29_01550 [Myxococcales bacterium]|nr:hypothetical protein [Myxococcota bacterium]MDW8280364.1 hypothetical protein [Myxococcales bacterium]
MMDHLQQRFGLLRGRAAALVAELQRPDRTPGDKAVLLAQRLLWRCGLSEHVRVGRIVLFELRSPPRIMRGLRDLVVRRAHQGDVADISAVDGAPEDLIRERFDRGDLCFVGQIEGRVLCHAWFHPGPQPFEEDRPTYCAWQLDERTFWSYDAASSTQSRASGVFVKVFQTALVSLFCDHGAERVQCSVRLANEGSMIMHERLGFRRLGMMTAVSLPQLKWLRFDGPAAARQWLVLFNRDLHLPVPPVEPPAPLGVA